jgi:formamidopyrimidine-DNA glycosylase
VEPAAAEDFTAAIAGHRIGSLLRRGKYLLFQLEPQGVLAAHLRMSGSLALHPSEEPRDPHDRLILSLQLPPTAGAEPPAVANGSAAEAPHRIPARRGSLRRELRFHDPRAFGRIRLLKDAREVTASLGPEPLDPQLQDATFHRLLSRRRRLKPLLLDQAVLAGLGNIYVDEALHAAGLHPLQSAAELNRTEAARLLAAIREVLRGAIERRGTTLGEGEGNYRSAGRSGENRDRLAVYGRSGKPCPRCGTAVQRIVVAQRGTHLCPRCQPSPAPSA